MSFDNSPQEYPILIAVSILSPVSTHILIPDCLRDFIVSATSSYSLSSMAVEPISSKFYSSSSASLSNFYSQFCIDFKAS